MCNCIANYTHLLTHFTCENPVLKYLSLKSLTTKYLALVFLGKCRSAVCQPEGYGDALPPMFCSAFYAHHLVERVHSSCTGPFIGVSWAVDILFSPSRTKKLLVANAQSSLFSRPFGLETFTK